MRIDTLWKNKTRALAALLWWGTLVSITNAADTLSWYEVEVIVFAENQPQKAVEEDIPLPAPEDEQIVSLKPAAIRTEFPREFQRISPRDLRLGQELARLKRSERYTPLLHIGWYQPGYSRSKARAVHLLNLEKSLDGTVKLARERYLHLFVDLLYYDREASSWGSKRSKLREHRRMRSRELHYIDHPRFGILVQAIPVKRDEEQTTKPSSVSDGST